MTGILIADRQEFFRLGLTQILERRPGWSVIAQADSGRTAIELALTRCPDAAFIDLALTDPNGSKVLQTIHTALPATQLIAVSAYVTPTVLKLVQSSGAKAFVAPDQPAAHFVEALNRSLAGHSFFAGSFLPSTEHETDSVPVQYVLSERQLQVLGLIATGRSTREIAAAMGLSTRTAESHIARIMNRLRIHSRVDLIRLAIRDKVV